MNTSDDPLAAWLHWFEHQRSGPWATTNGSQEALAQQWRQLMDGSLEQLAQTLSNAVDWQASLAAHVAAATKDAAAAASRISNPLPLAQLELLQRLFTSQPETDTAGDPNLAAGLFGHLTAWPILGLASAHERDWRGLQESIPAARRACERYADTLLAMMTDALERWQSRLLQSESPPVEADTLKELWLEALEAAWQAMLGSPEHAQRLLELNASMDRIREHGARVANGLFRSLGIPTREDLQGTQQRLHELRRELDGRGISSELAELRDDVDALRAELNALRGGIGESGNQP